jgi:hypothetical protein
MPDGFAWIHGHVVDIFCFERRFSAHRCIAWSAGIRWASQTISARVSIPHPSVRFLGRFLADFVAGQVTMLPWLARLVRLEWERIEITTPATVLWPASIPSSIFYRINGQRFVCTRSARCECCGSHGQFTNCGRGARPPLSFHGRRCFVFGARRITVRHASIDRHEASALLHLMNSEPFGAVCEAFFDLTESEAAREVGALFARWIADGLVAVNSDGPDPRSTLRPCAGCAA